MPDAEDRGRVYLEFVRQGNLIKASAIDAVSGTEVSIFGPATTPQGVLTERVVAKLKYVMNKKNA